MLTTNNVDYQLPRHYKEASFGTCQHSFVCSLSAS